jgi:DNA-directed RNA polymerase specialized sigma24 family protein
MPNPQLTRCPQETTQAVAVVAAARRTLLLRAHRRWLRREDLEDCYSQATLELVLRAGRPDAGFQSTVHIANALAQRFLSRIHDQRRALNGRSPTQTALDGALRLGPSSHGGIDVADPSASTEEQVAIRLELRSVRKAAEQLTDDQRLVLACQVALEMGCREFCEHTGWSAEKYRKVAQRARAKLKLVTGQTGITRTPAG